MSAGERAFGFLKMNERQGKPRRRGVTEIRGPYYTPMGKRYLEDVLETMGVYINTLKFAGGSFSLMPRKALAELIKLCHAHEVAVFDGRLSRVRPDAGTAGGRDLERLRDAACRRSRAPDRAGAQSLWGRVLTYRP